MSKKPAPKKTSVPKKKFSQFQQAILDALSEPAFLLNIQNQTILATNAAAQNKFSTTANENLPAKITEFFAPAEAEHQNSLFDLLRTVTEGKRGSLTLKPTKKACANDADPITLDLTELPRYRNQKLFLAKLKQTSTSLQIASDPATVAQNAPAPIIVCDKNGFTTWANTAFTKLTGYELQEIQGKEPQSFLFSDLQKSKSADPISASLNLGQPLKRDILIIHKDGTELWTKAHFEPNVDETGRLISYTGTFDDITKYRDFEKSIRKLNADLAEEKNRFELALVGTNSGVWDWDLQENEVYYSARFRKLLGYSKDEFPNKLSSLNKILHPEDQPHAKQVVLDHLTKQTNYDIEYRLMTKAGDYRWFRAKGQAVWDEFGEPIRMAGLVSDISDHKANEEKIRRSAKTDALTGLPNRTLFRERLTAAINASELQDTKIGLMLIDLDHFKDVNDTMGHPVGDELLRLVAARLSECVRDTDTVARLGGDEFAIIATDLNELADIEILARRLVNAIAKPFYIEGYTVNTAASIGITLHPDSIGSTDDLLRFADVALYDAKDSGRSMFKLYDKAMNDRLKMRSELQSDMQAALKNDQLELYYQPQINLSTMQIIGAEALIRWNHPDRGLVSPAAFIPIAETSRMLIPIGEWVIQEACRQTKIWHDLGFEPLVIGMNVSPLQFKHQDLLPNLFEAVTSSGVHPEWLEIEITEAATMEKGAIGLLHQLKDFGVKLAIDDFGTGYSSLSRLKSFPVDRLKIDRSFVREIERHQDNKAISSSIIQLGHSLNINVIAEGVETMDELTCLSEMGCDDVQGYLFARPMPAKDFETFMQIQNKAHTQIDEEKGKITRIRQVV